MNNIDLTNFNISKSNIDRSWHESPRILHTIDYIQFLSIYNVKRRHLLYLCANRLLKVK